MNATQYCARIKALGLSQEGAAILLGCSGRTGQNWAAYGPPQAVAMLLLAVRSLPELQKLAKRVNGSRE